MTVFLRILMIVMVAILAFCTYLVFSSLEYLAVFLASFVLTVAFGVFLALVDKPRDIPDTLSRNDAKTEHTEQPSPDIAPEPDVPAVIHGSELVIIPQRRNGILAVITSDTLQDFFENGDTVSLDTLREKGIIRNNGICRIRIVVTSQVTLALNIEADLITNADAQCFIRCGGTVKKYR